MNEITIANIQEQDIPEIYALGLSTPEVQVVTGEPDYYPEEMLKSLITSPHDIYLAAKCDGKLAGYILGSYNPYLKEAYLIDLVVKTEYRGNGIATLFFNKINETLKEKGCIWVWSLVHEDNEKMMKILEKKGFTKGRDFTFFYKVRPF